MEYNRNPNQYFHYQTWYQATYVLTLLTHMLSLLFRRSLPVSVDLLHATTGILFLQLEVTPTCFIGCVDPRMHVVAPPPIHPSPLQSVSIKGLQYRILCYNLSAYGKCYNIILDFFSLVF